MRYSALTILISFTVLLGCSDPSCDDDTFSLIGTWRLVEFCVSPGTAQCPRQVPDFNESYQFFVDGAVDFIGRDASCSGVYEIVENRINFTSTSDSTCLFGLVILDIIDPCTIALSPLCFETCYFRYEKT
jgi:hypothetical protein